jgi:enoyl-CoA hydratase
MSGDILTTLDGRILRITLNRPERGNAVSDEMVGELTRLVLGAPGSADIVVLRGAGEDFCVGRVAPPSPPPDREPEALDRRRFSDVVFDCYGALRNVAVPVIGVVQGRALGFGCAVAAACDITVASSAARFQVPEMAHNILPTMVMSAFVDRLSRKAISYLVYSCAEVDALRAREIGLVSDVVPAAKLDDAVAELCAAMLRAPRPALLGVKEYVRSAPDMATAGAVEYARNLHATVNSSSEMRKKR